MPNIKASSQNNPSLPLMKPASPMNIPEIKAPVNISSMQGIPPNINPNPNLNMTNPLPYGNIPNPNISQNLQANKNLFPQNNNLWVGKYAFYVCILLRQSVSPDFPR